MAPVRIAVLSDDRLLCEELLRIVGAEASLQVVGHDEEAVLRPPLRAAQPDVLLVDSRMRKALGLCAVLKRDEKPAVVFFMATRDDDEWAREALEAGARGILAKDARAEEMVKALRLVHEGQIWARRHVMAACMERLAAVSSAQRAGNAVLNLRLTGREREVLRLAAAGLSNKELADRLAISQGTVKTHLTRIFDKLGLRGRTELAAAFHGIIPPAPEHPSSRRSLP